MYVWEMTELNAYFGAVELCISWAPDRANLLTNSRDCRQRRRELLTSGAGTGLDLARHPERVRNGETDRDANPSKQWPNVPTTGQSTNVQLNRLRKKNGSSGRIRTYNPSVNSEQVLATSALHTQTSES